MSSRGIYNLVRGLTKPYIGAQFNYQQNDFKVWSAQMMASSIKNIEPGKVIDIVRGKIVVKTGDGAILLSNIEPLINLKVGVYL